MRFGSEKRIDALELQCWRRLLRVPWTPRRWNQSILKEINPEYSLEGLILSWSSNTLATWCQELTRWKRSWCWERLKAKGEGGSRGWDGWSSRQPTPVFLPGEPHGQRSLAGYSPWGCKESDRTERLSTAHMYVRKVLSLGLKLTNY